MKKSTKIIRVSITVVMFIIAACFSIAAFIFFGSIAAVLDGGYGCLNSAIPFFMVGMVLTAIIFGFMIMVSLVTSHTIGETFSRFITICNEEINELYEYVMDESDKLDK